MCKLKVQEEIVWPEWWASRCCSCRGQRVGRCKHGCCDHKQSWNQPGEIHLFEVWSACVPLVFFFFGFFFVPVWSGFKDQGCSWSSFRQQTWKNVFHRNRETAGVYTVKLSVLCTPRKKTHPKITVLSLLTSKFSILWERTSGIGKYLES